MRNYFVLLFDRAVFCVDAGTHLREGARTSLYKLVRHALAHFRAQELCECRGGRPGLPVPDKPYGLCGRKAPFEGDG